MVDNRLLSAYVAELEALRTHGRDLAQSFPDIAARLDIGPRRSRDPSVERVVESAAFLAARLRMMMEDSASELPMTLLSMLAPTLLDPVPAMAIAELRAGAEPRAVPRGTRFDYRVEGQALIGFRTTMNVTVAPLSLRLQRFKPRNFADGLAVRLTGTPPARLMLCIGNDEVSAAVLLDALTENLAAIHVVQPGGDAGGSVMAPPNRLHVHGFTDAEAALPVHPASHQAHRVLAEYIVFPDKFRFVSLSGVPLANGTEIRFLFSRPLALPAAPPDDLITVNRVPVVNLWSTAATPFDVSGKQIEYPVRVDTLRYRLVECHTVEHVDMYGPEGGEAVRLDPMMGLGDLRNTDIRWGWRRMTSPTRSEVMLYFQGLDYQSLGRHRFLAAPQVLASNRDLPQRTRVGSPLQPVESLGDWRCALATVPTAYRPALTETRAMRSLLGYVRSSVTGVAGSALGDYLRQFPGGDTAAWIDAVGGVSFRRVASVRGGVPQTGLAAVIAFDSMRCPTASRGMVKRVLAELFESQRGINQIQEAIVVAR